jgi:hypothetical protein
MGCRPKDLSHCFNNERATAIVDLLAPPHDPIWTPSWRLASKATIPENQDRSISSASATHAFDHVFMHGVSVMLDAPKVKTILVQTNEGLMSRLTYMTYCYPHTSILIGDVL